MGPVVRLLVGASCEAAGGASSEVAGGASSEAAVGGH